MVLQIHDRLRDRLALEAAKIIATEGVRDYKTAKRKASERLGNSYYGSLPSNIEIERAIFSYHNTYTLNHDLLLTELRSVALIVMQWLEQYSPYLVGPVLEGTANQTSPITIHISSDMLESIIDVLQQQEFNPAMDECRLIINGETAYIPTLKFNFEACEIEVIVFNLRQQFQNPKSRSRNKSMRKISYKSLKRSINQSNGKLGSVL